MKKIKLLTSLSCVGVVSGVAVAASGCTWSYKVNEEEDTGIKILQGAWRFDGRRLEWDRFLWDYQTAPFIFRNTDNPEQNETELHLDKSVFNNEKFAKELAEKNIYKIEDNGTDPVFGLDTEVLSLEGRICVYPKAFSDGANLKLRITLNKEPAEFGAGGEGETYDISSNVAINNKLWTISALGFPKDEDEMWKINTGETTKEAVNLGWFQLKDENGNTVTTDQSKNITLDFDKDNIEWFPPLNIDDYIEMTYDTFTNKYAVTVKQGWTAPIVEGGRECSYSLVTYWRTNDDTVISEALFHGLMVHS